MAKSRKSLRVTAARKVGGARTRQHELETQVAEYAAKLAAVGRVRAHAEYAVDGTILEVNDNFVKAVGYAADELRGKHHRMLVEPAIANSAEYVDMWGKLARGEYHGGRYRRVVKGGGMVWLQGYYSPIRTEEGITKIIEYATDITAEMTAEADRKGQIAAINRVQAIIEFTLDGTVLNANENFLKTMGYSMEEIRGRHHRLFVEQGYADSEAYRQFWARLGSGAFDAGQYKRLAKGGREIWIQASYNPIFDPDGKPYKVIEYATDITEHMKAAETARIKSALDKAGANVMLADDKLDIIYLNEAAQRLFAEMQNDLRRELPGFDATKLVGANIDTLYKNPAQQHQLLTNLTGTHSDQMTVGGRIIRISATPVMDANGKRLGTVVEWWDRTQEVTIEQEVAELVEKALDGDLTRRVTASGRSGFLAILATGLNHLIDNMAQTVRQIKIAAATVHRGAEEISQGNTNLSQRTEEQSSSLEQTASSMEQMTSTVKQNADNAGQANQLATAARDQAEKGGVVVGKAVRAMTDINEASKKIADIISVIDEIAFQTNLLALNAAVEAARAGEQGRGFAVVATEVRSLAGRSATAAKEIKELIKDSVHKVNDGSALVTQSGQTLEQIVASVKKVSDIVAEIAAASREQSSGIEQVNKAVMQMDEMTQQNAALVEQATAASHSMAEQAAELNALMERYTIAEDADGAAAARPAVRAAERRASDRPWAGKEAAAPRAGGPKRPAPAPTKAKVAAGSDAEWEEF